MPRRNRDNLGNFLPNTPTASNNQPSLFFGGCELEEPLGEKLHLFEELIGKKKKKNPFLLNQWMKIEMTKGIERESQGCLPH